MSVPQPPTLFDRRPAQSAFETSPNVPTIAGSIIPQTAGTTITLKKPVSRRSTVTGFLPLPSISASPVCTPTTSISSRDYGFDTDRSVSNDSYTTAPSSPSSLRASPKWISTPPTPPPKLFKRSVTCVTRRPFSSLAASTSFPTSMTPHGSDRSMQRRNSVPAMSLATKPSDLYPSVGRRKTKVRHTGTNPIARPLRSVPSKEPMRYFTRPRPLFDVAHEVSMDSRDVHRGFENRRSVSASMTPVVDQERVKDNVRKYHALLELLSTEVSYMQDLRILVSIYLRQIPTLTLKRTSSSSSTFSRNSSFSALSRASSSAHLNNGPRLSQLQPLTSLSSTKEREKSPVRHIFTNSEVDALTRNAEEVLQFHENFVEDLRTAMAPFGFRMELSSEHSVNEILKGSTQNIDEGIAIVSAKFATEASRFTSYEMFCAGHPEAVDLVRKAQNTHPSEWEAFEQKCGASAYVMLNGHTSSDDNPSLAAAVETRLNTKSRRNSTASIDGAARYVRSRSNSFAKDRELSADNLRNRSRLTFMDYLIKPVQRICKYPLLLDQLKTSKALLGASELRVLGPSDGNVAVESAAQAMRHVASAVDEARRKQDVVVRSALIASRIVYPHVMPSSSHGMLQVLTPSFLSSLGPCHLAGSLDVILTPTVGASNINVKYLGAFLYLGGYLILAKVVRGKGYEPRHWFRLGDFRIANTLESEAWLPCSFRLTCKGHEFELAAPCQREKEVWLTAIHESLAYPTFDWINEPIANIDGKGSLTDTMPSPLDGPFEAIVPLPTINSVPEIAPEHSDELRERLLSVLAADSSKQFSPTSPEAPSVPSRRSSSTSVKPPFTPPEYETFIIRRNLPSARTQIDAGLSDVISAACLSARSQATSQEEELFQPLNTSHQASPNRPTPNPKLLSRSSASSGLNRLRKHESVRVPRRKSLIQFDEPAPKTYTSRTKSLTAQKRPQKLTVKTYNSDGADRTSNIFFLPDGCQCHSPLPSCSGSSTTAPSKPPSIRASPTLEVPPYTNGARVPRPEPEHPKPRPVSFVGSVRSLFTRPPSPARGSTMTNSPASYEEKPHKPANVFKRWVKGSTSQHRRSLSAPTSNEHGQALNESHILPEISDFGEPLKLVESPAPM